jgi:hypothetical protein
LLQAVLFEAKDSAMNVGDRGSGSVASLLSPRLNMLKKKSSSKNNLLEEDQAFVWDSLETILLANAVSHQFGEFLVREEILNSKDLTRLFREDSVCSKWMSRKIKLYMEELVDAMKPPFKELLKIEISGKNLAEALIRMHKLIEAIFKIDFSFEIRSSMRTVKQSCGKRNVDYYQIVGRLVMLRFLGPMLINPQGCGLLNRSPTRDELRSLSNASKILVRKLLYF